MKNEKNCSLCCIEKSLNKRVLCNDCFKIRNFILHHGKDVLLEFVNNHPISKSVCVVAPSAPTYTSSHQF